MRKDPRAALAASRNNNPRSKELPPADGSRRQVSAQLRRAARTASIPLP
jgi:hypothetical protein